MYQATFLYDGDVEHVGVMHSDGTISVVHIERAGDRLQLVIEPAHGHDYAITDVLPWADG